MPLISHEMRRMESEAAETDAQVQRLRREVAGARQECHRLEQVCMAKLLTVQRPKICGGLIAVTFAVCL